MPRCTWPAFAQACKNRHLVVVDVPADVSTDPEALVALLIDLASPRGDFALSAEKTAVGARLLCAFADATDVDMIVQAINAQEDNIHTGWASEYHCRLDRTAAESIRGAATMIGPARPGPDPIRSTTF